MENILVSIYSQEKLYIYSDLSLSSFSLKVHQTCYNHKSLMISYQTPKCISHYLSQPRYVPLSLDKQSPHGINDSITLFLNKQALAFFQLYLSLSKLLIRQCTPLVVHLYQFPSDPLLTFCCICQGNILLIYKTSF